MKILSGENTNEKGYMWRTRVRVKILKMEGTWGIWEKKATETIIYLFFLMLHIINMICWPQYKLTFGILYLLDFPTGEVTK